MGRKPLGDKARKPIAARISPEAHDILSAEAARIGSLGKAIDAAATALAKSKPKPA